MVGQTPQNTGTRSPHFDSSTSNYINFKFEPTLSIMKYKKIKKNKKLIFFPKI